MKHITKKLTLILAIVMLVSIMQINAMAVGQLKSDNVLTFDNMLEIKDGRLISHDSAQQVIDEYFNFRDLSFDLAETPSEEDIGTVRADEKVIKDEIERNKAIELLGPENGVYVLSAISTPTVLSARQIDKTEKLEVDVYEWTWVNYNDGMDGPPDTFGFATEHRLTLVKDDTGYFVEDDCYDELDITGMRSASFSEEILQDIRQKAIIDNTVSITSAPIIAKDDAPNINTNYLVNAAAANTTNMTSAAYDVGKAIDYADSWVIKDRTSTMQNTSYYNTCLST